MLALKVFNGFLSKYHYIDASVYRINQNGVESVSLLLNIVSKAGLNLINSTPYQ